LLAMESCGSASTSSCPGSCWRRPRSSVCKAGSVVRWLGRGRSRSLSTAAPSGSRCAQAAAYGARRRRSCATSSRAPRPWAFRSDLPVSPDPNPWPGIRVAVDDQVNGISLLAALRAYISGGAYATFEENVKGTLEPGMLADLQVYSGDPLDEAAEVKWDEL